MVFRFSHKWLLARVASLVVALASVVASGAAHAESGPITYVDATHGSDGNTRLASGEEFIPRIDPSPQSDSPWRLQAFGNEGSAYGVEEGTVADALDAAPLVTTLTGLTSGDRYNVFAYFWTDRPGASLEGSLEPPAGSGIEVPPVTPPGSREAAEATPEMFASEVVVEEGDRQLMQVSLGQIAADDRGEIKVWIEGQPAGDNSAQVAYDGVGYVVDVEPLPVEGGDLFDWWPWIVALAIGFPVFILLAARRRGRVSIVDEAGQE